MSSNIASKRKRRSEEGSNPNNDVDSARSGLVSLNGLSYLLAPDLSVCTSRKHVTSFAQQPSYTQGQKISIILNSGSYFIDPQNSFLNLTVTNTGNCNARLGMGSACNLIRRIVISSRSGDEIERVDRVNQLAVVLDRYTKSSQWMNTVGSAAGYTDMVTSLSDPDDDETDFNCIYRSGTAGGRDERTYSIPLSSISSLFRSYDKLLPSHLCSGMRFEFELESGDIAYRMTPKLTEDTTFNYVVSDVELCMDAYQLTDSVSRVLNETAATSGLEIPFVTYSHVSDSVKEG
jgi:hypothetical protein